MPANPPARGFSIWPEPAHSPARPPTLSVPAAPLLIAAVTKDGSKLALELPPLVPRDAKDLRACHTDLKRPKVRIKEQVENSAPRAVHECLAEKGDDASVHLIVEGGATVHLFMESGAIETLSTGQALADRFGNWGDEAEVVRLRKEDNLRVGKVVALHQ